MMLKATLYKTRRLCHCYSKRYYIPRLKRYNAFSSLSSNESFSKIFNQDKIDNLKCKVNNLMLWYEQLIGLDEVRSAQNKVIEVHHRFSLAQEKRREANSELTNLRNIIKDIQDELSVTSKGDERYISLITQEHKLLKDEVRLTDKFNSLEREEREYFSFLTSAVKESHEQERIQTNKTKYLSIIGSIIGTLIGIIGSSVNNHLKISQIKEMVLISSKDIRNDLDEVCRKIDTLLIQFVPKGVDPKMVNRLRDVQSSVKMIRSKCTTKQSFNIEESLLNIEESINDIVICCENTDDRHLQDREIVQNVNVDIKSLFKIVGSFALLLIVTRALWSS